MAKADDKSTPVGVWLLLDKAFERIVQQVRAPEAATAQIHRILRDGQWRGKSFDGTAIYDSADLDGNPADFLIKPHLPQLSRWGNSAWQKDIWRWVKDLDIANCSATFDLRKYDDHIESRMSSSPIEGQIISPIGLRAMNGIARIEIFLPIDGAETPADMSPGPGIATTAAEKRNQGGSPGRYGWPELIRRLKGQHIPFDTLSDFEEWCLLNVKLHNGKDPKNPPDIKTVRSAIKKHQLDTFASFLNSA